MRYLLEQKVIIRRFRSIGSDKFANSATATADAHVQPLDAEAASNSGGAFGQTYVAYVSIDDLPSPTTIKPGDELEDVKGNTYKVNSVDIRDYGINEHVKVVMDRQTE